MSIHTSKERLLSSSLPLSTFNCCVVSNCFNLYSVDIYNRKYGKYQNAVLSTDPPKQSDYAIGFHNYSSGQHLELLRWFVAVWQGIWICRSPEILRHPKGVYLRHHRNEDLEKSPKDIPRLILLFDAYPLQISTAAPPSRRHPSWRCEVLRWGCTHCHIEWMVLWCFRSVEWSWMESQRFPNFTIKTNCYGSNLIVFQNLGW